MKDNDHERPWRRNGNVLACGTVIGGRYRIGCLIGQGGMGSVYAAEDLRLHGKLRALKTHVLPAFDRRSCAEEAGLLMRLSHPHLPQLIDYFPPDEQGLEILVMDYIDGVTLERRFRSLGRAMELHEALSVALQLCGALTYLHRQHPPIVHRDLKPSNIMIDARGSVRLIDFGIARTYKDGGIRDTSLLGTPGFAAPEQSGEGQSDERTDVYGLGALLVYLLGGGRHYRKEDGPIRLPGIPNALCDTLEKMVASRKELRYRTMEDAEQELLKWWEPYGEAAQQGRGWTAAWPGGPSMQSLGPSRNPLAAGQTFFAGGGRALGAAGQSFAGAGQTFAGAGPVPNGGGQTFAGAGPVHRGGQALAASGPIPARAGELTAAGAQAYIIAVASLSPGAGATFLAITLAHMLGGRQFPCAAVEAPGLEPEWYALLSGDAHAPAGGRRAEADSRYAGWKAGGVSWKALLPHSRATEGADERLKFRLMLASGVQEPAILVDYSSQWLGGFGHEELTAADLLVVAADPNAARWSQLRMRKINKITGMRVQSGLRTVWIANKDAAFPQRKEWLRLLPAAPSAHVPHLPPAEWNSLVWSGRWLDASPKLHAPVSRALEPVARLIADSVRKRQMKTGKL